MSVTINVEEKSSIIDELETNFEKIKNTLNIFVKMKKGDKIMKTTDCSNNISYYTVGTEDWQKTLRWWHGEDRNKTINYLARANNFLLKYLKVLQDQ